MTEPNENQFDKVAADFWLDNIASLTQHAQFPFAEPLPDLFNGQEPDADYEFDTD